MDYITNNILAEDLFKYYVNDNEVDNDKMNMNDNDEKDNKDYTIYKMPFNARLLDKLHYYGYKIGEDFTITIC